MEAETEVNDTVAVALVKEDLKDEREVDDRLQWLLGGGGAEWREVEA